MKDNAQITVNWETPDPFYGYTHLLQTVMDKHAIEKNLGKAVNMLKSGKATALFVSPNSEDVEEWRFLLIANEEIEVRHYTNINRDSWDIEEAIPQRLAVRYINSIIR